MAATGRRKLAMEASDGELRVVLMGEARGLAASRLT
jgi:hypothetical protein